MPFELMVSTLRTARTKWHGRALGLISIRSSVSHPGVPMLSIALAE